MTPKPQQPNPFDTDALGKAILQILWRRKYIILFAITVAVVAGVVYLSQATPLYTSTSRIYVEQTGPKLITEQEGVMTQTKNYLFTQTELIRSAPILSHLLEDPALDNMKTFAGISNGLQYLKNHLKVSVGREDEIINISLENPYPEESAILVNKTVEAYIDYHSTRKRSSSSEVLKILKTEKEKRDQELNHKIDALLQFTRENGTIPAEENDNNIIMSRLERLSQALTEVQLEIVDARAEYDAFTKVMQDSLRVRHFIENRGETGYQVNTIVNQLKTEQEVLQKRLESLQQHGTSQHPAVHTTIVQIAQIKRRIAEEENNFIEAYRDVLVQKVASATQKEQQIRQSLEEQQKLALELNAKTTELSMLRSEVKRTENFCDILDSSIKEINLGENSGALNISILEAARVPEHTSYPVKGRILAMTMMLGFVLGGLLAVGVEWADNRVHTSDEVMALLGVPILGAVPRMPENESPRQRGQKVLLEPSGPEAEAYRSIRTAIYFGVAKENARTVVITSPMEGDGKTTMTCNLGAVMAQSGQKTLIIDGDFRRPMVHKIFNLRIPSGFSNVLNGEIPVEEAIQTGPVPGLDILPCGPVPQNPSEMLSSPGCINIIRDLVGQYDRVLIDSPPVLRVTDARILASFSDLSVIVLRAQKSTRKAAEQSREALASVGSRLLGAVVNDVQLQKNSYGYYAGYYGYGTYGRQADSLMGRHDSSAKSPPASRVQAVVEKTPVNKPPRNQAGHSR